MATRIDAHQHFWQLSKPFDYGWLDEPRHAPIRRDFLPADLAPRIKAAGIERTVFVQTQHNLDEALWVLEMAREHPFIAGVVGWVDLASPACEEQVLEMKRHAKFAGVRHITQGEPDDDFIVRPDVVRGLKVLEKHRVPFDLLFYVKHLKHAATLGRMLPELPMVIDHLSKPRIREQVLDDWLPNLRAAAACPNISCKISGMITEADWKSWKPSDLTPYIDAALKCFGPDRLMFGSDWPVCELAGTYQQVVDATAMHLDALSAGEQAAIWGGTAAKFYGLAVS